jgi:hypothetical protein
MTPYIGGFEPVIIMLVDVAPVDTAHRYHLAGTEMLPFLHHEQAAFGRITASAAGY